MREESLAHRPPPCVLVLAGFDPSGGAGLLADAEAVREAGAIPLCVPTALTVQTQTRARGFTPAPPGYLLEAARALLEEQEVRAIKIGMLASPAIARAIAALLEESPASRLPVLLDPVLVSSSGASLFHGTSDEAFAAVAALWARALLTPNALEAQALLGLDAAPRSLQAIEDAGRALVQRGAGAVLIKGGHAEGEESIDLLLERAAPDPLHANQFVWDANHLHLRTSRLVGPRLRAESGRPLEARGTGCRLASALAARLALGDSALEAARQAKASVARYLLRAGRAGDVMIARHSGETP